MEHLTWRRGAAEDQPLLLTLFAAVKAEEFVSLGWPAQQLEPLLEMQFRARQHSYAHTYPGAVDMILCLEDGTPVGRHLVERQTDCYRSVDLAVLPEYRNRGIGTWALAQMQQMAALEGVPFQLRVVKANEALRLYERIGFQRVSSDELSWEMEWQARNTQPVTKPELAQSIALGSSAQANREEVLNKIFAFLREIGLVIHPGPVPANAFLPGIQMVSGGLRVDEDALLYPGDLLHEAGHLAVMTPERRAEEFPSSSDAGEEMAALAWSYAAALHAGILPKIVFHENGYRGHAQSILHDFEAGNCVGLPYLWWIGLTTQPLPGSPSIYPGMLRWLRQAPPDTEAAGEIEHSLQAR